MKDALVRVKVQREHMAALHWMGQPGFVGKFAAWEGKNRAHYADRQHGGLALNKFDGIRPGEAAVVPLASFDAQFYFIGRLRTPWRRRRDCPKWHDRYNGPLCWAGLAPLWQAALTRLQGKTRLQVLYWMHEALRDLVLQRLRHDAVATGTFALCSLVRPNPIASTVVTLFGIDGNRPTLHGLDCLGGTPPIGLTPRSLSVLIRHRFFPSTLTQVIGLMILALIFSPNGRELLAPVQPFGFIGAPLSINRLIGLQWMVHALYPDQAEGDLYAKVKEFYPLV